jgi:hypothetical protein
MVIIILGCPSDARYSSFYGECSCVDNTKTFEMPAALDEPGCETDSNTPTYFLKQLTTFPECSGDKFWNPRT